MSAILPLQNPPRFRGGFETIVAALLGRDGQPLAESEWRGGVTGETMPAPAFFSSSMVGGSWGLPEDDDVKPVSEFGDERAFLPSSVGVVFQCEMNAPNTARGDVVMQHARNAMQRSLWSQVAAHVHDNGAAIGCDASGDPIVNPTLRGSATTPAGYVDASPSSIAGAVQGLLDSVCEDQLLTEPVFLVARAWLPHFIKSGLVKWSDELGAYLLLGTHRIAFDCIANEGPAGTTTNADGSEVWIYMMLPVQAAVADESDGDVVAVRAALRNVYTVRAERQFGYWFDPERVRAAKASIDGCAS